MASSSDMGFVPMTSILKKPDPRDKECSDWVATEKVHGSSFQFSTYDGVNISAGSRRRALDGEESFIRCNIKELTAKYQEFALKTWHIIHSGDRWAQYREPSTEFEEDEDISDDDADNEDEAENETKSDDQKETKSLETNDMPEICRVRIYGELYGGGGINRPDKLAAQKEIIYCDEFRFYVFGLTINKKWVNIQELNDLCKEAGFPYYAKPVCAPTATMEDLKKHLGDSGFMRSKSAMTDKEDDVKTNIEGVVMTPLKRPDFRLHAVKFLATAFTDVREAQANKGNKPKAAAVNLNDYCTKQRYHSVISKLDIHERNDTKMVVYMYIEDIIKETGNQNIHFRMKEKWAKLVLSWLAEDEYNADPTVLEEIVKSGGGDKKTEKKGKNKK